MSSFINVNEKIMIPFQPVEIRFFEKETVTLNVFQRFILEAVQCGYTIEEMAVATQLTPKLFENELVRMVLQKLVDKTQEGFFLSDVSKNLLMVSECVDRLNNEEKKGCLDLITGDLQEYKLDEYCDDIGTSLWLFPKISEFDIDGISIEDNFEFFSKYINAFNDYSDEQIPKILSSIYIELNVRNRKKCYQDKECLRIPCLIGDYELSDIRGNASEEEINIEGQFYELCYSVKSESLDCKRDIIKSLLEIEKYDAELLSDKAVCLLNEYKLYQELLTEQKVCYFDTVSGNYSFEIKPFESKRKRKMNFKIPCRFSLTEDEKVKMYKEMEKRLNLPEGITLIEKECKELKYYISCNVEDLWRDIFV